MPFPSFSEPEHVSWFAGWRSSPERARLAKRPVAYFCAEYALDDRIPAYAGGLGVLAGDVVREAADRKFPLVGVGLFYRQGYVCPVRTPGGQLVERCVDHDPKALGLKPVLAGRVPARARVTVQDRVVEIAAWEWRRGDVRVFLLDTNLPENDPADRAITNRLYVSDKETRLKQEIILGIGGLRMLDAVGVSPSVFHLNEGHSALLGVELVRRYMEERRLAFDEALQFARRRVVLTNHTLVPAGHEVYDTDLVGLLLAKYAEELAVPIQDLMRLGLVHESSSFSMTSLALRLSGVVNAVSKLHAIKARDIWRDHPMAPVTNGIHLPTWDRVGNGASAPGAFWRKHQTSKTALLERIRERTGRDWPADALLIGWARRIVPYKRPMDLFADRERFAALARSTDRPIRVVFAGHPHPDDQDGMALRDALCGAIDGDLKDVAAFLPDYNMEVAEELTSGCDIWLNTPVVGFEACGTSGMKAALNGVLPCTAKDGWAYEADLDGAGWALAGDHRATDVLDVLERDVLPAYYENRNARGVPERWEEMMRASRAMILDRFSATRMLREYAETLYT